MSREVLETIRRLDLADIEIQFAIQCAPLITGLKVGNLLIIKQDSYDEARKLLENTNISCDCLLASRQKMILLLYQKEKLEKVLAEGRAEELLRGMGYGSTSLSDVLPDVRMRYQQYMAGNGEFPHELGLLLGYPAEDVEGFIYNGGKNCLYTGYWKVYYRLPEKLRLFRKFEQAREWLVEQLSNGVEMADVIRLYGEQQ